MKTQIYTLSFLALAFFGSAQEEKKNPDTTRVNMGKMEIILIDHSKESDYEKIDTVDAAPDDNEKKIYKGHWAGIDVGVNMLMDQNFQRNFEDYPYWETDISKSYVWNMNILEHKFRIYKNYVGITTGFGFNLNAFHFSNNYIINNSTDTTYAVLDSVYSYSKNKLQVNYFTVPLLLEFCTNENDDKTFYLAAGVVGGIRLSSKSVIVKENEGVKERLVRKDDFGINPFKLDATLRMGYGTFGVCASYNLIPLFEKDRTIELYPFSIGVTCNF